MQKHCDKSAFLLIILFLHVVSSYPGRAHSETNVPIPPKNLSYSPGKGIEISPIDLLIKAAGTFVFQGAPNPNKPDVNKTGTSWIGYLDFEKRFGDWGLLFLRIQPGNGNTISPGLNLFSGVNYNAHDNGPKPELRQYWYKQRLFDNQISLTAGKVQSRNLLDRSIYAGDDDAQFLADVFNKSLAIEWPSRYGPGLNIAVAPQKIGFLEFGVNYFDAPGKWVHLGRNNVFSFETKLKSRRGNYRFYSWVNKRKHRMLLKQQDKNLNYGAGFGFDQEIADIFGIFGRLGWQRPDLIPADGGATIGFTWSGGGQMTGKYWGRNEDVLGIAIGQLFPSKQYHDAGNPSGAEGHLELYYNFALGKHFHISPDLQLIWNPNGVTKESQGDDGAIFVYGIRARFDM